MKLAEAINSANEAPRMDLRDMVSPSTLARPLRETNDLVLAEKETGVK
jgi:hypothetical protein